MGENLYHTLVNSNNMRHHLNDVQENHFMQKLMGITCPKEDVVVPLFMSGTIVCAETSSPTQKQLDDCPRIVLTSLHDWYPHSVCFPKGSHSEEEEDSFAGIAEIRVDALRSKAHETEIDPGICNTVHNPSLITTRLVSQVIIDDTKIQDATRITDLEEEVFEG